MNLFQYPVPNSIFFSTSSFGGCSSPGCRSQEVVAAPVDLLLEVEEVALSVDDDDKHDDNDNDDKEDDDSCIVIVFCFTRHYDHGFGYLRPFYHGIGKMKTHRRVYWTAHLSKMQNKCNQVRLNGSN
jgi:hypothetical protein